MTSTTLGVKVDERLRGRLKTAASQMDRTPHWLIKQAIGVYLERIESGDIPPEVLLTASLPGGHEVGASHNTGEHD
ncbi:hypothetical protein, partial [Paraburkholderia fungorum]|uniref:hypothetical protein n=1 Tax=Paraburkholderia fungorum TaxID=134537 RepID=UPI00241DDDE9